MKEQEFKDWLVQKVKSPNTLRNIVSYCKKVEKHEGSLDDYYDANNTKSLLDKLIYTSDDERHNIPVRHSIPCTGNPRTNTSSYRSAVVQYFNFRSNIHAAGQVAGPKTSKAPSKCNQSTSSKSKKRNTNWPVLHSVSNDDIYELSKPIVPYVMFLDPEIVKFIADENEKNRSYIENTLRSNGITCTEKYLWDNSPCAFPGVRRIAAKETKAKYRNDPSFIEKAPDLNTAIYLDDNDMPKQIWSFILRDTYFSKEGPNGYSLAHLIDHKSSRNRMFDTPKVKNRAAIVGEFDKSPTCPVDAPLYGLFTSAANSVYVPNALMKPTDFNTDLRILLISKAIQLYSGVCKVLPDGITLRAPSDPRFDINNPDFKWANPIGAGPDLKIRLQHFYDYRKAFYAKGTFNSMYL